MIIDPSEQECPCGLQATRLVAQQVNKHFLYILWACEACAIRWDRSLRMIVIQNALSYGPGKRKKDRAELREQSRKKLYT